MLNQLHHAINWHAPWYRTLAVPSLDLKPFIEIKDWLNAAIPTPIYNYQQQPICFVRQDELPPNTAYESFIAQTGQVPTRDNFHDLLGGLIWLNFPKTKAVFNQLHQQDIDKVGIQQTRTPRRNALTLFDENGGVVVSNDWQVLHALQQFDWLSALFTYRQSWLDGRTEFFPIGHALLEKLLEPRKAITAHVLLVMVADSWWQQTIQRQRQALDGFISRRLLTLDFVPKMLQPLPVLGIPGFCEGQTDAFYADKSVFRDNRQPRLTSIWPIDEV